ncbi:MAG TPA: SCO family protein [Gemmatimonadales bacterium]
MSARERWGVTALGAVVAVTLAWWALALWPLSTEAPSWLVRTRSVCFNTTATGLPDAGGWLLLAGQPLGMLGFLFVVWGAAVRDGMRALARGWPGRFSLAAAAVTLVAGSGAAAWRVADAQSRRDFAAGDVPGTYPRLDWPAPPFALVDQHGEEVTLDDFDGPLLVTFAYAHCETICPLIVHDVLDARRRLEPTVELDVVIVTLDPWRDTPERLAHVARQWNLGDRERVLSGPVADVEVVLNAWRVARSRDERTGDVVHPNLSYVVDRAGRVAYAVNGGVDAIVTLVERL